LRSSTSCCHGFLHRCSKAISVARIIVAAC
jgi:hypothetical protein